MNKLFTIITTIAITIILLSYNSFAEQTITSAEAINHIGEQATVCGTAVSIKYATSSCYLPTFINLDKPYPEQIFTAVIWGVDRYKFVPPPEELQGQQICVSGLLKLYRDKPEISITDPTQIKH